jgi:predicted membrane-bound spermidine synthase
VIFEDVFTCEEIYKKTYDLILVDLCDPDEETTGLLKNLIMELRKQLHIGGVLLMNAGCVEPYSGKNGSPKQYCVELADFFMESLEDCRTFSYKIFVPSFMEHWCLLGMIAGPCTVECVDRSRMIGLMDWRASVGSVYDPIFSKMNDRFFRQVVDRELSWGC